MIDKHVRRLLGIELPNPRIEVSELYYERKYGDAPPGTQVDLSFAAILRRSRAADARSARRLLRRADDRDDLLETERLSGARHPHPSRAGATAERRLWRVSAPVAHGRANGCSGRSCWISGAGNERRHFF